MGARLVGCNRGVGCTRGIGCTRGVGRDCGGGIEVRLQVPSRHDGKGARVEGAKLDFRNGIGDDGAWNVFRLDLTKTERLLALTSGRKEGEQALGPERS